MSKWLKWILIVVAVLAALIGATAEAVPKCENLQRPPRSR